MVLLGPQVHYMPGKVKEDCPNCAVEAIDRKMCIRDRHTAGRPAVHPDAVLLCHRCALWRICQ